MLQRARGDDDRVDFVPAQAHIEQALNHRRLKLPLIIPRTAVSVMGGSTPSQFPICAEAEYIASPHIHYAIKISAKCRK